MIFKRPKPDPMTPPTYEPLRLLNKPKPYLRISHTVNAGGWDGSGEHLTKAATQWRTR